MLRVPMIKTFDGLYLYNPIGCKQAKPKKVICTGGKVLIYVGDKLPEHHNDIRDAGWEYVNVGSILSIDSSNVKLRKTAKKFPDTLSVIHYGAPAHAAGMGINTCKFASIKCRALCLNTAGNGSITGVQLARIARTRLSRWNTDLFWEMFSIDLATFARKAKRENKRLACRPNGTTDERSQELIAIMRDNPDIEFYDYSAVPSSLDIADELDNYSVTFSRKETTANLLHCLVALSRGYSIAIVADPEVKRIALRQRPDVFVDFDEHDLRLPEIDGQGKLGLLTPKGRMRSELKPTAKRRMTYVGYLQIDADFRIDHPAEQSAHRLRVLATTPMISVED